MIEWDIKTLVQFVRWPLKVEGMLTERIRNAYTLFKRWIKKMGFREMGGHRSTEEGRQVSTLREKQRLEKEISKMRPTCKSHTNDKVAKGECCQTKKSSW